MADTFDFKKLRKEYKKLKCPAGVFDPCTLPLERNKYFLEVSERSVGKTTNIILMGMLANKIDGTEIQYIRQRDDMLTPKNADKLMSTILAHGYIKKITGGRWNWAVYHSRKWRYALIDEDGKVIEKAPDPFMVCLSIDNNITYKSVYNAPKGDWIIFDEFISKYYSNEEFVDFCDLVMTIIRGRQKPIIFMLGNTIDRMNQYFYELEIDEDIAALQIGDHTEVITSKGTHIYLEIYAPKRSTLKDAFNALFFGFKNQKLGAITGEDWAITPCPRMQGKPKTVYTKNYFLQFEKNILQLELIEEEKRGICVYCHKANKFYDHAIIYSCDEKRDLRFRHQYGYDEIDKIFWTLYDRDKWLYGTNGDSATVKKYVSLCERS